jgi:hypothetical protein
MARARNQCGVLRSFATFSGEATVCAPLDLHPWKRSNRAYHQGLTSDYFDAHAGPNFEGAKHPTARFFGSQNLFVRPINRTLNISAPPMLGVLVSLLVNDVALDARGPVEKKDA